MSYRTTKNDTHTLPCRPSLLLRERGDSALSDLETAALALGWKTANSQRSLAGVLSHFGSLRKLTMATQAELARFRGVSETKAAQLFALFELQRRAAREAGRSQAITSPTDVYELLAPEMAPLAQESVRVILLDNRKQVIRIEEIFRGVSNECYVNPPEILRAAVAHAAQAIILVHNHPAGEPAPSKPDHAATQAVADACRTLNIEFTDHIIIGQPSNTGRQPYFSFAEDGILPIKRTGPPHKPSTVPENVIPFPTAKGGAK